MPENQRGARGQECRGEEDKRQEAVQAEENGHEEALGVAADVILTVLVAMTAATVTTTVTSAMLHLFLSSATTVAVTVAFFALALEQPTSTMTAVAVGFARTSIVTVVVVFVGR
mmetsp:Transcript_130509/g.194326  ORF Transcript_130509/g.194326 Transcript_130509/m.194326 type:complete len:114 (-) Transcript_130509:690-1031(-)